MAEKLKPCPFCGGEVSLKDMGYFWMISRSYKSSCKCRVFLESREFNRDNLGAMERAKERLIEKWNKRSNPWHTGTPTEEGWYLCAYDTDIYLANYWVGCGWLKQYRAEGIDCRQGLVAWQKIEPFKEK